MARRTTAELDTLAETLRSALVSDILDGLGHVDQALAPGVAPISPGTALVGYAYPTRTAPVDGFPEEPYVGLLEALDGIGADEVWLISSDTSAGLWGELTSSSVQARGGRGSVCDGYLRDTAMVRALGFPVFTRGSSPRDCNGRIEVERAESAVIGGVTVAAGDLVVGDDDGVVIVPSELVDVVIEAALAKSADESLFRAAVRDGMLPSVAYRTFGVL